MSENVLPERIAGETAKAYQALLDYCLMGAVRSIRQLHAQYCQQTDRIARRGLPAC